MATKKINSDNPEYIDNWSVNRLINELNSVEEKDVMLSWFSYGGSVLAGWQFAEYLMTTDKNTSANVTGLAASMGASLLPFFKTVIGAKQSWVMIHAPSGGTQTQRDTIKEQLFNALNSKINDDKFKAITGVTLKDALYQEGDNIVDYWLTGQQAFDVGIYNEVYDLTPVQEAQNLAKFGNILNSCKEDYGYKIPEKVYKTPANEGSSLGNQNQNVIKMDINKLKAENPDLYNQVLNLGKEAGVKAEKDRVGSFMVYNDVDAEAVKAGIASGEAMSATQAAEFNRKSVVAAVNKGIEDEAPKDTPTPQAKVNDVDEVTAKANAALAEMGITEEPKA